ATTSIGTAMGSETRVREPPGDARSDDADVPVHDRRCGPGAANLANGAIEVCLGGPGSAALLSADEADAAGATVDDDDDSSAASGALTVAMITSRREPK